MKKTLPVLLVCILTLVSVAGCTPKEPQVPPPADPVISKVGFGQITSIASSTELNVTEDGTVKPPTAQVDTVFAGVAFDQDGKVLKVSIDTAQTKVSYDKDLQVTSDLSAPGKTKIELGDAYGMKKASGIGKEWFEQIAEFENWMIGKSVDEIKSLKVKAVGDHPAVPDIEELTSTVTMTVHDYIAVVEKAYKNAVPVAEGGVKLGLGSEITTAKSRGYSESDGKETLPQASVDTTMAATVFDKNNKVVFTIIDTVQSTVAYDKDGKITSDKTAEGKSKLELGDAYGMKKVSSLGKEWYEQISELDSWMAGKSVAEIKSMKVAKRDDSHPAVPDEADLVSTVTMTVQDYIASVAKSYDRAK